ncbi:hypothetical protein AM305_04348, partial [Actinobacillus minor NM305]
INVKDSESNTVTSTAQVKDGAKGDKGAKGKDGSI